VVKKLISKLNNLSIGYQLVVHFLLISILPSIGLGVLVGYTVDNLIKKQVNESTNQVISKVNETLEYYIGNVQKISYLVALNNEIVNFFDQKSDDSNLDNEKVNDIRSYLKDFTMLYPEVAGILIANSEGDYISNDMFARTLDPLTEEIWYQEAARQKGIFTLLGHPKSNNIEMNASYQSSELISAVRAIVDPKTKQVKGVVLIEMKARVIAETAKSVRLGKTGYLLIVDDSGQNIYSPTYPFTSQIEKPWLSGSFSGSFQDEVSGSKLQFIYRKSPFTNWTTIGVFSTEDFIFGIQNIQFYVISFVFIITMLGITATAYLSTSISSRLRHLMKLMLYAERGDLSVRHGAEREDEIGLVGKSFNKMLTRMSTLIYLAEKQERKKREAELRALQEHIKPHFLYNTLDTIQWMARKREAPDIAEMVESLSKLFRIGLSNGRDIISLQDEVEHIRSYLTIQQIRYRDKLNFKIDFPEELLQLRVLKLIMQPIVENAIYHGIKERRGPGHIYLTARVTGDQLEICIQDDGRGMQPDQVEKVQKKLAQPFTEIETVESESAQGGYGLMNIQARLRLTFGEEYGIMLNSELGNGTKVTIIHPVIHAHEEKGKGAGNVG
jgi:two-component system sensor histidine kinase YesM